MRIVFACISLLVVLLLSACSVKFNMTGGGGVNPNLKTISIQTFANEAPVVVPYLGQLVTQKLQDRFLAQSRLALADNDPSIELTGSITSYTVAPTSVQGNATASQNRVTLTLRVDFKNNVETADSWTKTFSAFQDVDQSKDITSVERELLTEIVDQLTQNIFNDSLGKW